MRHRSFTDRSGNPWTVTEVTKGIPTYTESRERRLESRSGRRVSGESSRLTIRSYDHPWLCFESGRERRRLEAVPADWDALPDDELEDLLSRTQILS